MLALVHAVPGRLRFCSALLRTQPGLAADMVRAIRAIPGVTNVRLNAAIGSLVICHDLAVISAEAVIEQVGTPFPPRASSPLEPILEFLAQRLLGGVASAVVSALV